MRGEQFCLKWNNFQPTVCQSWSELRQASKFSDVTLLTEDEILLEAHRVVLSACSDFFKSILEKVKHPQPLLYLRGVTAFNLNHILDYVYRGEVQIYQENLDGFLSAAELLRIEGLVNEKVHDPPEVKIQTHNPPDVRIQNKIQDRKRAKSLTPDLDIDTQYIEMTDFKGNEDSTAVQKITDLTKMSVGETSEANDIIAELTLRIDGVYTCGNCGKTAKDKTHLKNHIETHIDGLVYSCDYCNKTFRSKNSLAIHISRCHKQMF